MVDKNIGFSEVRLIARGQWPEILTSLGVALPRKSTACQGCGGKDRFRFTDRYGGGEWLCSGGGDFQSGDGFALLGHVFGYSPSEQLKAVKGVLGLDHRISEQERKIIHQKAEAQREKIAEQIRLKEDRFRKDENVLTAVIELEDCIKLRKSHQRKTNRHHEPEQEERTAARILYGSLLESYQKQGVV